MATGSADSTIKVWDAAMARFNKISMDGKQHIWNGLGGIVLLTRFARAPFDCVSVFLVGSQTRFVPLEFNEL